VFGLFAVSLGMLVYSYYSIHRLRNQIGENHRLGHYTLEQQIGEGGMGKVFKARHAFLRRPTAIKLLRPELVDRESIARFEREASLASQLTHPNTIDIYDYGVTPEGIFFLVMEYIDGISLFQLVTQDGPLPPARVVTLLTQICESLEEAHGAGMIHRDLKPQNIMVCCRGGKADVVKVLDFGLVKQTETPGETTLTASAVLAGTPLYIAPERLRDPSSATASTDIYSLGAVAYYLLTGRETFQGKSVAEMLFQTINAPPPRPSDMQADIPLELDQLVADCLAKEPESRPDSVVEILRALEGLDCWGRWDQSLAQNWWKDHANKTAC
jgi:serine/threonine-protein kinase